LIGILTSGIITAQAFNCDLSGYKLGERVKAETKGDIVVLIRQGN
jgi:hypothetical protein